MVCAYACACVCVCVCFVFKNERSISSVGPSLSVHCSTPAARTPHHTHAQITKRIADFEDLKWDLEGKFRGLSLPSLPKRDLIGDSSVQHKIVLLERFLATIATTGKLATHYMTLQFLGTLPSVKRHLESTVHEALFTLRSLCQLVPRYLLTPCHEVPLSVLCLGATYASVNTVTIAKVCEP